MTTLYVVGRDASSCLMFVKAHQHQTIFTAMKPFSDLSFSRSPPPCSCVIGVGAWWDNPNIEDIMECILDYSMKRLQDDYFQQIKTNYMDLPDFSSPEECEAWLNSESGTELS